MNATAPNPRIVRIEVLESRRLLAASPLDPTFGHAGSVVTDFHTGGESARAVAVQADGKIIAAGNDNGQDGGDFALARYTAKGSLDAFFGKGGLVKTDFGSFDRALAVVVQKDGKIIAAGSSGSKIVLARYKSNGALDSTFGVGGKVSASIGGFFGDHVGLTLQADGKVLVTANNYNESASDFVLLRYSTAGKLDSSFGKKGKVTTDFGGNEFPRAVTVQKDGKIVVAGFTGGSSFAFARYKANGALDPSFGKGGKVVITPPGNGSFGLLNSVVVESGGRIVAAGDSTNHFNLIGLTSAGKLDSHFGKGGYLQTNFGQTASQTSEATGLVLGPHDTLYAGGLSGSSFVAAEYNATGALVTSFGAHGILIASSLPLGTSVDPDIAVQKDGKVLIAGISTSDHFLVARSR